MSLDFSGAEWNARTLRAWHLAILRFAVKLDNADRLAVTVIANEIDRLGQQHDGKPDFNFFRRNRFGAGVAIQLAPTSAIQPAHIIAWSCWRRAHQAAAQRAHFKSKQL
jgi:hypothetical protein